MRVEWEAHEFFMSRCEADEPAGASSEVIERMKHSFAVKW